MLDEINTNTYVNKIYNELGHYIIIGLTGRCGSGCSTTRDILCGTSKFNPEDYLGNIKTDAIHNDDRDKNVILNFAKHHPVEFEAIRVRDILTSFILESKNEFFELLNEVFRSNCGDGGKIKQDFYNYFNSNIGKYDKDLNYDSVCMKCESIWNSINNDIYHFIENINQDEYDFLFQGLSYISNIIREFLMNYVPNNDGYTVAYQYVGNIVRTYGKLKVIGGEKRYHEEGMYAVAKRINMLLKIMRRKEWIESNYKKEIRKRDKPIRKSDVHVVIDCIKNVFEAEYLKVRYHSFYLVALTLDDDTRKYRLKNNKNLKDLEIKIIDTREQPTMAKRLFTKYCIKNENNTKENDIEGRVYNKLFNEDNLCAKLYKAAYENSTNVFRLQDVDSCIQSADILINNNSTKEELALTIVRYVSLMQHPGLVPPTVDERCMQVAQAAKLNSGCISRQVGAVVSDSVGKIISVGWNDAPATLGNECISCIRRSFDQLVDREDELAYSYYELNQPEFRQKLIDIMKKTCDIDKQSIDDDELVRIFKKKAEEISEGLPLAFCFKDIYSAMNNQRNQVHTRAQHAEENALEASDKNRIINGTLYTTSSSCELCAKKALSYNIRRIVYIEPYTGITNDHVLGHEVKNGIRICRNRKYRVESMTVELFTGATQNAYTRLYSPLFPLKDELELRGIKLK